MSVALTGRKLDIYTYIQKNPGTTNAKIAKMFGLQKDSVRRQLSDKAFKGLIRKEDKNIYLSDVAAPVTKSKTKRELPTAVLLPETLKLIVDNPTSPDALRKFIPKQNLEGISSHPEIHTLETNTDNKFYLILSTSPPDAHLFFKETAFKLSGKNRVWKQVSDSKVKKTKWTNLEY